jgi:hypothetical protein
MNIMPMSESNIPANETDWWAAALALDRQVGRCNVHSDEAALLLAGHDPVTVSLKEAISIDTPEVSRADTRRLYQEFDGQTPRPLGEWLAAARKAGLVVHPIVAQIVDDTAVGTAPWSAGKVQRMTPSTSTNPDYSMLASPEQLIKAFGAFTGMNGAWFKTLGDTPYLEKARKVRGKSGRNGFPAMFCPLEVMLWLVNPNRKKGRKGLSEIRGWELLEQHFPKVHAANSAADPR